MDRDDRRFVYICSATPNQITNVVPLVQLRLDQVDHVLMLVGAHDPPTERDRETALGHIRSFNRVLKEIACRQKIGSLPKIDKIQNAPHDTQGWQKKVACKLKQIEVGNKESLLNVTGGTRSMMFGAMLGISDAQKGGQKPSPSWHAVVYLAHPARTEQLFPTVAKVPRYLNDMEILTLSEHLSLRNYKELDMPARNCREANARSRANFTHALVEKMSNSPLWKRNLRAMVLHGIVNNAEKAAESAGKGDHDVREASSSEFEDQAGNVTRRDRQHNSGRFWWNMFGMQGNIPGLYSIDASSISFKGKAATDYFTGGWFEEYLFLLCEDILGSCPDVKIHLGVSYVDIADGTNRPDGEVDIVIQVENDLHLIECKAGRVASMKNPHGVDRPAIHTIATRRRQIAGPTGSGRLVSFQTTENRRFRSSLESEARHSDITFWYGTDGLEKFKEWLRKLSPCR